MPMSTGQASNGQELNGSRPRVLIVDDERDGATALGMLLKLRGFVVEVVTDSTLCVPTLESFRPDVVFLDIAMPNVSGYDLARQIRSKSEFERLAIIALSGYADNAHKAQSIGSGCDDHLVKPVDLTTLEAAIAREMQKRRQKL